MNEEILFLNKDNSVIMNTYKDFKLFVLSFNVGEAEPKESIVELPNSNKILDFSESLLGDISYKRRPISIELNGRKKDKDYLDVYSKIQNLIHGKYLKVISSKEPNFYWYGRVKVKEYDPNLIIQKITIEVNVEPYKYDWNSSNEEWEWDSFSFENGIINDCKDINVDGETIVSIIGRRLHVIPIITVSEQMKVIYNKIEYSLEKGSNEVLNIEILPGENKLKFVGKGTVNIDYRGGSL